MKHQILVSSAALAVFTLAMNVQEAPSPVMSKAAWLALLDAQRSARWQDIFYHLADNFIISARDVKTPRLLWTKPYIPTKSFYGHLIMVKPNEVFLQVHRGTLYASDTFGMTTFNAVTGQQKWRTTYRYDASAWPTINEGVIVVSYESSGAISTGAVQALDARTSQFLWQIVGVSSYSYNKKKRGYLLFQCDQFPGRVINPKFFANIHTGK